MAKRSIDGVDVVVATEAQLASFPKAEEAVSRLDVPRMYDNSDPKSRVFVAMFDGTGNDMAKDPEHITNVGLLANQVEERARQNKNIGWYYKEGPGTQGGLTGTLDGATGGTYQERIDAMYDKFAARANKWLQEDPGVKISMVAVGFSRGAEQAAGFARAVHERGIVDTLAPEAAPLRAAGVTPQALALYDPVGTGEPARNDRRPPPSVVSGFQIVAADEKRTVFPSTTIMAQGQSADGRFLAVTTAGAHSDNGGGYLLNGLSSRNFNVMSTYLNKTLGEGTIDRVAVPVEPEKSVIHDSTQHKFFYRGTPERGVIDRAEPSGKLQVEPMDPAVLRQLNQRSQDGAAAPIEAPRQDLNKNQAATASAAALNLDANIRHLQKAPGFERHSMEDLSKVAFYRGLIIEREKDAPAEVRDAAVAKFDTTMQQPAMVKLLPDPAVKSEAQEQAAPVSEKLHKRDTYEQSL
jgi:hypothetical protein